MQYLFRTTYYIDWAGAHVVSILHPDFEDCDILVAQWRLDVRGAIRMSVGYTTVLGYGSGIARQFDEWLAVNYMN